MTGVYMNSMKSLICISIFALQASALIETPAQGMITNSPRSDGFGSQFQTIVYSAIYAEMNNKKFVYTPFKSIEHNYDNDPDFLPKKEELINFSKHYQINQDLSLQDNMNAGTFIRYFEANIESCVNSQSLKKIKEIFRSNKKREDYFDKSHFNIAVHIRRANPHDSRVAGTDTPDIFYLDTIQTLREEYTSEKTIFHIYSQGEIADFQKIYSENDTILHINESLEDTFTSLVLADALVTSASSLSYIAAILSEGAVYYTPFWHPPLPHWVQL